MGVFCLFEGDWWLCSLGKCVLRESFDGFLLCLVVLLIPFMHILQNGVFVLEEFFYSWDSSFVCGFYVGMVVS